jgi:trimeric autotransporter adhesin
MANITGTSGNDDLIGTSNADTIDGGLGADIMRGARGGDTYIVDNIGDQVIELSGQGTDTVRSYIDYTAPDHVEHVTLLGTALRATGNSLANTLTGNASDNVLDGRGGNDSMRGNAGNDTYHVDSSGDSVTESSNQGNDTVVSALSTYTLGSHMENLSLTGAALTGIGNGLDNILIGNASGNRLEGKGGNDRLDGGEGADQLIGGAGNDIYVIDNAGDSVQESSSGGTDTVESFIDYNLGNNIEHLTLRGSAVSGIGNSLVNNLTGNAADNTLDGRGGADRMGGGGGNDTYLVDSVSDQVVENADEGQDTIQTALNNYTLGANLENLRLTGNAVAGTGNALDNILYGNAHNNTLDGGAGNDTLKAGTGTDMLIGGTGDDIYETDGNDATIEWEGEGVDTIVSSEDCTLFFHDNVENLVLVGSAEYGEGNEEDNHIVGNERSNTLYGGSGNDTLDGGLGADVLFGGAGDDLYIFDNLGDDAREEWNDGGVDTVLAGFDYELNDDFENLILNDGAISGTGNDLDNDLSGNDADNFLDGREGADTLRGGRGDDTYYVDHVDDTAIEGEHDGFDVVFSEVDFRLGMGLEDLVLEDGAISGWGNELANHIYGNGEDNYLDGAGGADRMEGDWGDDQYLVDNAGDEVIETWDNGFEQVWSSIDYTLGEYVEQLNLLGNAQIGIGNDFDNILVGTDGNNILDGSWGADQMSGLDGDDVYYVDDSLDTIQEMGGNDRIITSTDFTNVAGVETLELAEDWFAQNATGRDGAENLVGNSMNNMLDGRSGADYMEGRQGDDIYIVEDQNDVAFEQWGEGWDTVRSSVDYSIAMGSDIEILELVGDAVRATGNDIFNELFGNDGDNILDGGIGPDEMEGGAGNDLYIIDDADYILEREGEGIDTVRSGLFSYELGDHFENLELIDGAWNGFGNSLNNRIVGNDADNFLDGRAGADVMIGGGGFFDQYEVDDVGDVVIEYADGGLDQVRSQVDYTLGANIERLELFGGPAIRATGNELDNFIYGNGFDNIIDGAQGADEMLGGFGDDIYYVDNIYDWASEHGGQGNDTVRSSIDYVLGSEIENLELIGGALNATGNWFENHLVGNDLDNVLDGLEGGDHMSGGMGNDTYHVDNDGDQVIEHNGQGDDTVYSSLFDYQLADNVETVYLVGGAMSVRANALANTIYGNALGNILDGGSGIDTYHGGAGDDLYILNSTAEQVYENSDEGIDTIRLQGGSYTLRDNVENLEFVVTGTGTGNSLNNLLKGGTGNDNLDGRLGADTMEGGTGNDTYTVDNVGDSVVEAAGAGSDTVLSSVSFTLGANIETLDLTGSTHISATGNELANVLDGNTGNNLMDGQGGADAMRGRTGNDTYIVDQAGDSVSEDSNSGYDIVQSSLATYTLTGNVEELILVGGALNGTGNNLANTLRGNELGNRLSGGLGADTYYGGAGNDVYILETGDFIVELAGGGSDEVRSFLSSGYTLGDNLEALVLEAGATGNGNALDNQITGNASANTLDGRGGADTMTGNGGNDVYLVDQAGDQVVEDAGAGTDTVRSALNYRLGNNLENLELTGTAANGWGNALDNDLAGNEQANQLWGEDGNDRLYGNGGNDYVFAGSGDDTLYDGLGADYVNGASGNDVIYFSADSYSDRVLGDDGDDVIYCTGVDGQAYGGAGFDTYVADFSAAGVLVETVGADIAGTPRYLAINGVSTEEFERHEITGGTFNDRIGGFLGGDLLIGGAGNDTLFGYKGNDVLYGGEGDDLIHGQHGANIMYGGAGRDQFAYLQASEVTGVDHIADFELGVDRIAFGGMYNGGYLMEISNDFFRMSHIDTNSDGAVDSTLLRVDTNGWVGGESFYDVAIVDDVLLSSLSSISWG